MKVFLLIYSRWGQNDMTAVTMEAVEGFDDGVGRRISGMVGGNTTHATNGQRAGEHPVSSKMGKLGKWGSQERRS